MIKPGINVTLKTTRTLGKTQVCLQKSNFIFTPLTTSMHRIYRRVIILYHTAPVCKTDYVEQCTMLFSFFVDVFMYLITPT